MSKTVTAEVAEKIEHTPEERAERKRAAEARSLTRDRVRMLDNVQSCLRRAGAAVALGDVDVHDQWVYAAENQLTAYKSFVALSLPATATDAPTAPVDAS